MYHQLHFPSSSSSTACFCYKSLSLFLPTYNPLQNIRACPLALPVRLFGRPTTSTNLRQSLQVQNICSLPIEFGATRLLVTRSTSSVVRLWYNNPIDTGWLFGSFGLYSESPEHVTDNDDDAPCRLFVCSK